MTIDNTYIVSGIYGINMSIQYHTMRCKQCKKRIPLNVFRAIVTHSDCWFEFFNEGDEDD